MDSRHFPSWKAAHRNAYLRHHQSASVNEVRSSFRRSVEGHQAALAQCATFHDRRDDDIQKLACASSAVASESLE